MTPRVSIVMAAKNYARFLPMAVRSVQAQSHQDWELIIINDGSTDNTFEVVEPFLSDQRIRYRETEGIGQSRAKNLGIELCRADRIAFLDADDAWLRRKLERQITVLNAHPDLGVLASGRHIIPERLTDTADYELELGDTPESLAPISRDEIFISNPICFSSVLVRREVFDRVGLFDPDLDLAIDYDLWLRASAHYQFARLPEKLVLYRTGHANLSSRQADRIATAFTIMNRRRSGISPAAIARGYGSTCQSMAWNLRKTSMIQSIQWYARSFRWSGHRLSALKGIAGTLLRRRCAAA